MFMRRVNSMAILASLRPVLCLCLLLPGPALADSPPSRLAQVEPPDGSDPGERPGLKPGDYVRLKASLPPKRIKGSVQSLDATQITIVDRRGESSSISWEAVKRIDVQVGMRRRYGRAALIFGGAGAVLGLAMSKGDSCGLGLCYEGRDHPEMAGIGVVVFAVTGLISERASVPTAPRWKRVQQPYQPAAATVTGLGITPREEARP